MPVDGVVSKQTWGTSDYWRLEAALQYGPTSFQFELPNPEWIRGWIAKQFTTKTRELSSQWEEIPGQISVS